MIRLFISLILSLLMYLIYHTLFIFDYLDLFLLCVIIYFDFTDEDLFFYLIPLSIFNDYFLNIYFGISAIIFFMAYLFRIIMSKNMYFKSNFLKFLYYFLTVLIYNVIISMLIGITFDSSIIIIPLRIFLDIAVIYLLNMFMESKIVVSYSK
jgi:hypothetical protein